MRVCSAASAVCVVLVLNGAGASRAQAPAAAARPLVERMMAKPAEAGRVGQVDTAVVAALSEAASDAARRDVLDAHADALTPQLQLAMRDKGVELRRAGRMAAAGNAFLSARDIAERRGDRAGAALALVGYSSVPGVLGDYPAALAALDEAMAIGES